MLTHQHLAVLGDKVIVVRPETPYVELPHVDPVKRTFPRENPTSTPRFNDMQPNPGTKIMESPRMDNCYQNGYPSSESRMEIRTKEGTVNNWFLPPPTYQSLN